MPEFFFPQNKCGIGNKVEKVNFNFVDSCDIVPTPPPIFDCTRPLLVREPEIPCPTFVPSSELNVTYAGGGSDASCKPSSIDFTITPLPKDKCPPDGSCAFAFDLDIAVAIPPPPCPEINVGEFKVTTGFADQPCIITAQNRFEIKSNYIPGVDCNDPGTCEFIADLEIVVPIPRTPCPQLVVKTFDVNTIYNDACEPQPSKFTITPRSIIREGCSDKDNCENVLKELGLTLQQYTRGRELPFSQKSDKQKEAEKRCAEYENECAFDFDLSLTVPIPRPPCPDIAIKNFSVSSVYENSNSKCSPQNKFTITKKRETEDCLNPQKADTCDFEIDLTLVVPIPEPPCPILNVKTFNVKTFFADRVLCQNVKALAYSDATKLPPVGKIDTVYTTTNDNKFFNWDAVNNLYVLVEQSECAVLVYDTKKSLPSVGANGTLYTTADDNKFYKWLNGKSYAEVPDCGGESKFEITTKITPSDDCRQSSTCEFDLELEIAVPLPMPPCPAIKVGKFTVESRYDECITKENKSKFEIVPKVTKGINCDEPDKCEFEINLELLVPIPKPLCPTFNVTKFDVKSFYNTEKCAVGPSVFKVTPKPSPPLDCEKPREQQQPKCEFDIELEINVPIPLPPPCPEVRVGFFNVNYVNNITYENIDKLYSGNRFVITSSKNKNECGDTTNCVFDFDVSINVPIPACPVFNINSFVVKSGYVDCLAGAENKFNITKKTDECSFDVDLEIVVPIPRPESPVFGTNLGVRPFFFGGNCIPGKQLPVCPAGGGGGGGVVGAESWFTVEPVSIGGCCDDGDAQEIFGFLFDLNIAIPLPKLIQEITFEPQKIKFDLLWCDPLLPFGKNVTRWDFKAQIDPWINCCDRGAKAEFKPELEIKYNLPRWPCEYVDLWPRNFSFPIEFIDKAGVVTPAPTGSFLKIRIEPKPPLGPCMPCRWEIIPELRIPKQCDYYVFEYSRKDSVINPRYYTCYKDFDDAFPGVNNAQRSFNDWFEILIEQDPVDQCKYKIRTYSKPAIYVPCETTRYVLDRTRCTILPFFCNTIAQIESQSELEIAIEQDQTDCCLFNIWYYLKLGVLRPICSGSVYVTDSGTGSKLGSGTLTCVDTSSGPEYKIDIALDAAACPTTTTSGGGTLPMTATPTLAPNFELTTKTMKVVTNVELIDGQLNVTYDTITVLAS